MENAEEVMQILERFTRLKQKEIPKELDDYLQYVAKTGDTVFKWSNLKYLFREKLLNVITHFYDTTPRIDEIPQYPNVDPFNYESMKSSLLERLELFNAAPFTIQRLCELLIDPKKQYNRIDKFMRALEKNILVSTVEPGRKRTESENGDSLDSVVNGDISLDVNVDIDMDNESLFTIEATQNGNGTASATSPIGGSTESTNDTESVSDTTKPQGEESDVVVNVTSTHEPPVGDDDDLQPSPKKAKLDVDDTIASSSTTKETAVKLDEIVKEATDGNVEETDSLVPKVSSDEKVPEKVIESSGSEALPETKVDTEKTIVDSVTAVTEEKKKVTKPEISVEEITSNENIVETAKEKSSSGNTSSIPESTTASNDSNKENTEVVGSSVCKEDAKLDEISSAVEENEKKEVAEKIVEKHETEKGEKELANGGTTAVKETLIATQSEVDLKESAHKSCDSSDKSNNEADETAEKSVSTSEVKETIISDKVVGESIKKAESDTEKLITSSSSSSTATTVAKGADEKTEDIETCVTTTGDDNKSADTAAPVVAVETATSTTSTSASALKIDAAAATKEAIASNEIVVPAKQIDKKILEVKTDSVETTAPVVVKSVVAEIVPPTIALNDQPMDEDAITNNIDEVVMAESTTTTTIASTIGESNEMATDAMEAIVSTEAVKIDDPTDGMDVDDTSPQAEAMDQ